MSRAQTAKRFDCSKATVTQRLKLLEAPAAILRKVHAGEISPDSLLEALRHDPDTPERDKALKALLNGAAKTREQVRAGSRGDDESSSRKTLRRSTREILSALGERVPELAEDEVYNNVQLIHAAYIGFVNGKYGVRKLEKLIEDLV